MAVPILTYHSLSDGRGPVSLPPATFREHMAVLRDAGANAISVSDYVAAVQAGREIARTSVVLTFEDGYRDFAEVVAPVLQASGWRATVFLPVEPIDREQPWDPGDGCPRPLLTWPMVKQLQEHGVEFAAHSMTHNDLTQLPHDAAVGEIVMSGRRIHERTGRAAEGFAPPFGHSSPQLRKEIARHYRWSVGTRMNRADAGADLFDLPRIEMWYFRNVRHWRRYVEREWTPYFAWRRALRTIKGWL
jgi:peptidoglycan/xylan/chitin deacetylase (PgdA/CDA1 family)